MLQYNIQRLKDTALDFHKLTGIMIVLYDDQFNCIFSYPPKIIPFCKKLRKSPNMTQKCLNCDREALRLCQTEKTTKVYRCHFGLSEAIAPIMEGDNPIGYLMLGGVVMEVDRAQITENIRNLPPELHMAQDELLELLSGMPNVDRETLIAAANIMEICACYLASKNIVNSQSTPLHVSVRNYIKEHLASPNLTLNEICRHFSVSRSTLYAISSQSFGMGISDYIRYCRIEYAKKLLVKNNMSIAQISERCGFSAPNKFTKTFKQLVGVLPKNYLRYSKENQP